MALRQTSIEPMVRSSRVWLSLLLLAACSSVGTMGQFYYEDGDFEKARGEFERAVEARPNDPVASFWLGKTYAELGQFEPMRLAWEACLASSLRYAEDIENLTAEYWSMQQADGTARAEATPADYRGSLAAFRDALAIDPGNTRSLQGLAYVFMQIDSVDQARGIYEQLIKDNPADPAAYQALGSIHLQAGRYAEAVDYVEHTVAMDPFDTEALRLLGFVYENLERYAEAVEVAEQLAALAPEDLAIWVRLGRLYDRVGEPERSELAYAQALALDPADAAALGGVAHLRVGLGDDEAALPLLELLTVLSPEDRQVWLELARIYRERGLHEHSARAQQRASGPASGQVDPEEAAPAAVVIDDEDGSVTTDGD